MYKHVWHRTIFGSEYFPKHPQILYDGLVQRWTNLLGTVNGQGKLTIDNSNNVAYASTDGTIIWQTRTGGSEKQYQLVLGADGNLAV